VSVHLLDASVLIPITSPEHVHHERAARWAVGQPRLALCPVVEGALVRYAVRLGATAGVVQDSLRVWRARPGFEFWPDDISYVDADLSAVRGHRQVTDAYLVAVARAHGGLLATLDDGVAQSHPQHTVLLPSL
jgi:predicted nucleic acid-binding protein